MCTASSSAEAEGPVGMSVWSQVAQAELCSELQVADIGSMTCMRQ